MYMGKMLHQLDMVHELENLFSACYTLLFPVLLPICRKHLALLQNAHSLLQSYTGCYV